MFACFGIGAVSCVWPMSGCMLAALCVYVGGVLVGVNIKVDSF